MKVLVTGGGGFLGQRIVQMLIERGDTVVTLNRNKYESLTELGVKQHLGSIVDLDLIIAAAIGCEAIIHTAAKAGVWGDYEDYRQTNVVGTRNVITACRRLGIRKLVYTSSPSVVFAGEDQEGVDESAPYPEEFATHYPATKAEAERAVLAAASANLATVALRPHLIWGPGDNHLAPRIIARAGRLRLVGGGQKKVDAVYIDNAAAAHLLALDALAPQADCNGKAYFITNHEPWPMANIVNGILKSAALPPVTKKIPFKLALNLATRLEKLYTLLRIKREPPLTRFVALQLGTAHWFNNERATEDLGYRPQVSMEEGFRRLENQL